MCLGPFRSKRVVRIGTFMITVPSRQTRGEDILKALVTFVADNNVDWSNRAYVCTDSALNMLGNKKGLIGLYIKSIACALLL